MGSAVLNALRWHGLLLLHDAELPSVSGIVAGGPVRGSWWAHPKGHAIFRAANELHDRRDVVAVKLVKGKVTFVHRRLWLALQALAQAATTRGLSPAARRLLVMTEQVHTETGAHELVVRPWSLRARPMALAAALEKLGARGATAC